MKLWAKHLINNQQQHEDKSQIVSTLLNRQHNGLLLSFLCSFKLFLFCWALVIFMMCCFSFTRLIGYKLPLSLQLLATFNNHHHQHFQAVVTTTVSNWWRTFIWNMTIGWNQLDCPTLTNRTQGHNNNNFASTSLQLLVILCNFSFTSSTNVSCGSSK